MITLLRPELDQYIHDHTTPQAELFDRLREETYRSLEDPQMQVGRVEGSFLKLMVQVSGARRILEIGTYSGYSALSMASGLPADGRLITCDVDPRATEVARRYFDESPWGERIEIRLAPARDTLSELARESAQFDLVFLDADKESYVDYWEAALPMLGRGGLVIADNALWSGRVLAPETESDHGIVRFNAHVRSDDRVEHVLLSIRDGVMLARKR
jgi:caffeoyl-CoA O-methyltransferase